MDTVRLYFVLDLHFAWSMKIGPIITREIQWFGGCLVASFSSPLPVTVVIKSILCIGTRQNCPWQNQVTWKRGQQMDQESTVIISAFWQKIVRDILLGDLGIVLNCIIPPWTHLLTFGLEQKNNNFFVHLFPWPHWLGIYFYSALLVHYHSWQCKVCFLFLTD